MGVLAMAKKKSYLVDCGDASFYFEEGRLYNERYLKEVFKRRLLERLANNDPDIFPGVRFRDGAGNLVKPQVQVVLVPAEEPENT